MKIADVPQDLDPTFEGKKKLCYAVNESGELVATTTSGWEVEATVKGYAWEMINLELQQTRERVKAREVSALFYFMKVRQMDRKLLAQNMGINSLRVWWHLKPKVFENLPEYWLRKYSYCLEVPIHKLKNYKGEE